jgi:hypothetical protein
LIPSLCIERLRRRAHIKRHAPNNCLIYPIERASVDSVRGVVGLGGGRGRGRFLGSPRCSLAARLSGPERQHRSANGDNEGQAQAVRSGGLDGRATARHSGHHVTQRATRSIAALRSQIFWKNLLQPLQRSAPAPPEPADGSSCSLERETRRRGWGNLSPVRFRRDLQSRLVRDAGAPTSPTPPPRRPGAVLWALQTRPRSSDAEKRFKQQRQSFDARLALELRRAPELNLRFVDDADVFVSANPRAQDPGTAHASEARFCVTIKRKRSNHRCSSRGRQNLTLKAQGDRPTGPSPMFVSYIEALFQAWNGMVSARISPRFTVGKLTPRI